MLGTLTKSQIDQVLYSQVIGRIGCSVEDKPYIVPVAYAYDGKHIYLHAQEGMKLSMMRENPQVCFEVDVLENMANWRSVVVAGFFEELDNEEAEAKGIKLLTERFMPMITSETAKSAHHTQDSQIIEKGFKPIVYRINITERTGRFEKSD